MTRLVQIADDHGTDTSIVRLVGTGGDTLVALFTYLVSEDVAEQFFLQVSSPNRNLSRFSPQPFDTIAISQILALIEDRGYETDALVSHVRFYEAKVLAQIDEDGSPATPFVRPSTGAVSRPATKDEIVKCLGLPTATGKGKEKHQIGKLARSGAETVPIVITERLLNHHFLVAGSTGSGKSHLLANLAHVASAMGRCIILFDHKPDHQHHHEDNPDAEFRDHFIHGGNAGPRSVQYWTLSQVDPNADARLLSIPARELDPEVLAGTVFYRSGEENQAETFAAIAAAYAGSKSGENWTLGELCSFVVQNNKAVIEGMFGGGEMPLNSATLNAIKRKLRYGGKRIPSFIDVIPKLSALGAMRREVGQIDGVFCPGLNVIRITEDDARGYALFLSHLLRRAVEGRATAAQGGGGGSENAIGEMLVIIDEAADIFKAESRYLRSAASGMLAERIRKGRSLRIGYVIGISSNECG